MSNYQIRKFTAEDIKPMIDLGEKMYKEGAYNGLSYSKEKCQKLGEYILNNEHKTAGWVATQDGQIIGMMLVQLTSYFFSDDKMASDLLLYVDPNKRKSLRVAIRLINTATDWAKSKGAKEFRPGSSVGVETQRVEKLYNFMKFETIGNVFRKELS